MLGSDCPVCPPSGGEGLCGCCHLQRMRARKQDCLEVRGVHKTDGQIGCHVRASIPPSLLLCAVPEQALLAPHIHLNASHASRAPSHTHTSHADAAPAHANNSNGSLLQAPPAATTYAEQCYLKYLRQLLEGRPFHIGNNLANIKARQDAMGVR